MLQPKRVFPISIDLGTQSSEGLSAPFLSSDIENRRGTHSGKNRPTLKEKKEQLLTILTFYSSSLEIDYINPNKFLEIDHLDPSLSPEIDLLEPSLSPEADHLDNDTSLSAKAYWLS